MIVYENDKICIEQRDGHERIYRKNTDSADLWDMLADYARFKGINMKEFKDLYLGIKKNMEEFPVGDSERGS